MIRWKGKNSHTHTQTHEIKMIDFMVNEDDSALDNKKKWKYTYKKIFPIFTKKTHFKNA